jgi:hypothetical protein
VLFDGTVVSDDSIEIELIIGQDYKVTLDGVDYVVTAWDDGEGNGAIGSESMWRGDEYVDTEPPFIVSIWDNVAWFYTINDGDEHALRIVADIAEVHKIDAKYLPDTVMQNKYLTRYHAYMLSGSNFLADVFACDVWNQLDGVSTIPYTDTDWKYIESVMLGTAGVYTLHMYNSFFNGVGCGSIVSDDGREFINIIIDGTHIDGDYLLICQMVINITPDKNAGTITCEWNTTGKEISLQ